MEDDYADEMVRSLENLSRGVDEASEIVRKSVRGLKVVHAQKGLLRCKFIIPNDVSVSVVYFLLIIYIQNSKPTTSVLFSSWYSYQDPIMTDWFIGAEDAYLYYG